MRMATYIDMNISSLLTADPFNGWTVRRSTENSLVEPIVHYVFPKRGVELRCDVRERISVMFFTLTKITADLLELGQDCSRKGIRSAFGRPSKIGKPGAHPILGTINPWDRFSFESYTIHFEYSLADDQCCSVTIMRPDAVP